MTLGPCNYGSQISALFAPRVAAENVLQFNLTRFYDNCNARASGSVGLYY